MWFWWWLLATEVTMVETGKKSNGCFQKSYIYRQNIALSARQRNRAAEMQRNKCMGCAQLRGSDKKRNGVKIASEGRQTPGNLSKAPEKLWHVIIAIIITTIILVVPVIILSLFFSSCALRHPRKYQWQCLLSFCIIWTLYKKMPPNCLTFKNTYTHHIFTEGNKGNTAQFPTVLKTGDVFHLR